MYFIGIYKKAFNIYSSRDKGVKRGEKFKVGRKEIKVWFVFNKRHQNFINLLREISKFVYSDARLCESFANLINLTTEEIASEGHDLSWTLVRKIALERMPLKGAILLQFIDLLSGINKRGEKFTLQILKEYTGADKP